MRDNKNDLSLKDYHMISIPEGSVELRDDRIKKSWAEEVDGFYLAPFPVTQRLYCSIMRTSIESEVNPYAPVVNVSWYDAVVFCNRFSQFSGLQESYTITEQEGEPVVNWNQNSNGYRLPTEAEWQYACRAGSTGYRYGELESIAWYSGNSGGKLQEAGQKLPNDWKLYDMLGNVWEWCWDIYDPVVYGSYRVFRGGSWAEEARGCGATCRRRSHPTFRIDDLGFRLARSL